MEGTRGVYEERDLADVRRPLPYCGRSLHPRPPRTRSLTSGPLRTFVVLDPTADGPRVSVGLAPTDGSWQRGSRRGPSFGGGL